MDRAVPLVLALRLRRVIACVLISAFMVPAPLVAYADEITPDSSASLSPSTDAPAGADMAPVEPAGEVLGEETASSPATDEPAQPEAPVSEEPPAEPQALMAAPAAGESSNSSKSSIDTKFYTEPDPVTGSLVYKYPLTLPPGRNNAGPSLALQYTSQQGEDTNVMGYGWSVDIPYIERINKTGTENLYTQSYFRSSLDGELATTSAGTDTYGAKIESGNFNRYQFAGSTNWIVTDKNGNTYTFGTSTSARLDNPSDSSQIYRWLLQEVRDPNGNFISYQYIKDGGQIYPYKITYTNTSTTAGRFEADFVNEARSDVATSSATGFPVVSSKRINEIQVKIDGSIVREYMLGYGTGDNAARSLLTSITESGRGDTGSTTTLPATIFQYRTVNKGWSTSAITTPINFSDKTVLADVNGDSLVDIIDSHRDSDGSIFRTTYINTGAGWTASSTWQVPVYFFVTKSGVPTTDQGVRLGDVNGDGLVDLIHSYDSLASSTKVYINTGAGWSATTTWAPPIQFMNSTATTSDLGARVIDANGDGLADIVKGTNGSYSAYINNGNGWVASSTWNPPIDFVNGSNIRPLQIADINGDGLQDIIEAHSGDALGTANKIYINNGRGWTLDSQITFPEDFANGSFSDKGVRLADVNGDGLPDVIRSHATITGGGNAVYLNTGHGWTASSTWLAPVDFVVDTTDKQVRLVDANGDGLIDMVQGYDATNNKVYLNNSRRVDLLAKITYPEGGNAQFTYKSAAEYQNGSTLLNPKLPFAVNTVSTIALDDGLGTVASTSYSYRGGSYYFASTTDRRFAGFQKITKLDTAGNTTATYFHQGNTSSTATGEYQDDGNKIGRVYRTESYDLSNNLYSKSIVKWDEVSLGNGRYFVKLAQQVDFAYDGDSDHKEKADSYVYDDSTGNATGHVSWGEVTGSDDGTFSDTGSDKRIASSTYASSTAGYIVGLLASTTISDQTGAKVSESRLYYDNQAYRGVTTGNLTKREDWVLGTTYASSTWGYNAYGLPTSMSDPRSKQTTYAYDSSYFYVSTTTNPLGQTTATTYDYSSGKVATTTDANGATFVTVYDGLDRPIEQKQPDTASTSPLVVRSDIVYTDTALPSVHRTDYFSSATSTETYTYLDGLGRTAQQRTEAEKNGDYTVQDFKYDSRGLLSKQGIPYFKNGSAKTASTSRSAFYRSYSYDALGRVSIIADAVGTTSKSYDDWKVTTTDPNGSTKDFLYDAFGNLVKVTEHLGASTYDTAYEYNGNNNLTKITDALGNIRQFSYNGLGRQLTNGDLHAVSDSSYGTTTYTYDDVGNKTSSLDPKSQTINFAYDNLNRVSSEDYTGQAGTEKSYTYDSCAYGAGRLCSVGTASATTTYAYDAMGHVVSETKTVTGTTTSFVTAYAYDRAGNVVTVTYPDSSLVSYLYNSAGLLDAVSQHESGTATSTAIVLDYDYGPDGQVIYQHNGNGTETFNTYNENALYRLTDRKTIGPGMDMMMLEREFGAGEDEADIDSVSSTSTLSRAAMYSATSSALLDTGEGDLLALRTPTSLTSYLGQDKRGRDKFSTKFFQNPIFLEDTQGDFVQRQQGITQETAGWNIQGTSYTAQVPENGSTLFTFTGNGTQLAVSAAGMGTGKRTADISDAGIVLHDALGTGTDIELVSGDGYLRKSIVLNSAPSTPGDYQQTFKISNGHLLDVRIDNQLVSETGAIESSGEAQILSDGKVVAYIWPPVAEDSREQADPRHRTSISIRYELKANSLYLTKTIPSALLEGATYPVRADFTLSTYAGVGDGYVGSGYYGIPNHWSNQHSDDGSGGGGADYTGTYIATDVSMFSNAHGESNIYRAFIPFDTSSLPDDATISSSTLYGYVTSKTNNYNDSYDYVTVYQGNQASPTQLVPADFNDCGDAETSPTKGSNDKDLTSVSTGAYLGWTLNSTGRGWINKTGYTQLCLREGHDAQNQEPTGNGTSWQENRLQIASYEATGTSTDPYLEIVYTVPNSTPTAPTHLLVEGRTNAVNVIDTTPEFSAQFNDASTTLPEFSDHYEIQVATSSAYWGAPLWDSGETALATTTPEGDQSIDISYGGTPLALDNTTYYWRIKFWDDGGEVSPWSSGNDYFRMADDGSLLQDLHYTYDAVGNVTGVDDEVASMPLTYTYDALNRLTLASTSPGAASQFYEGYTYNALGDLLSKGTSTSTGGANTYSLDLEKDSTQKTSHADTSAFDITGDMTFEAWLNPESQPSNNWYSLMDKWGESPSTDLAYLFMYGDESGTKKFKFYTSPDGSSVPSITINYGLTTGAWTHVALVYTASLGKAELFINGVSQGSATGLATSIHNSTAAVGFGGMVQDVYRFDGKIDDIRLWNTARSSSQILANKGTQLTGSESNLVAYYKLNNDYTDSTANGNTLTPLNSPVFSASVPFAGGADNPSYAYAGTGYANPHAPTSYASSTYIYDNNGNLTSGGGLGYSWDYLNRLTAAGNGSATSTFAYDDTGLRVKTVTATTTTYLPNKYYNVTGSTTEKYIYANGQLVATVSNIAATSSAAGTYRYWNHTDHLGGSNVTSDDTGVGVETTTYYPFGSTLSDTKTSAFDQSRKYIGEETEPMGGLSYLNARYMQGTRGQFVSADPMYFALGDSNRIKALSGQDMQVYLQNPQQLNSYSYAGNSPITLKDPNGLCFGPAIALLPVCVGAALGVTETLATNPDASVSEILLGAAGGAAQGAIAEERLLAAPIVGSIAFVTSLLQDRVAKKDLDYRKAFFAGGSSALGLSILKTAKGGVYTISGNNASDLTTRVGNTIFGGATESAYSLFYQNTFSSPKPNQVNTNPQQSNALLGIVNSFKASNSTQAQAIKNLLTAFTNNN